MTKEEWIERELVKGPAPTEWGVRDNDLNVTPCPDEQAARDYQAEHGGDVVSRATYEVTWAKP